MNFAPQLNICAGCRVPLVQSDTESIASSTPFTYQIITNPTFGILSYDAFNLPIGLAIDSTTGIISGTITDPSIASYTVIIKATNKRGTGEGVLTINVINSLAFILRGGGIGTWPSGYTNPTVEISLDGGAFSAVALSDIGTTVYNASSQIKLKQTLVSNITVTGLKLFGVIIEMQTPATASLVLLAGSQVSAVGTVISGTTQAIAELSQGSTLLASTANPISAGAINSVVDISGFTFDSGTSGEVLLPGNTGGTAQIQAGFVTEVILKF